MKRDMDVIRTLLLRAEADPKGMREVAIREIPGGSMTVDFHLRLMEDGGLVIHAPQDDGWSTLWITWKGHDFLNAVRQDTLWRKAQAMISESVEGVSFAVLTSLITQLAQRTLGIS